MKNVTKMLLAATIVFLVSAGTANSGELLNRYNQDLQKLLAEQAKYPQQDHQVFGRIRIARERSAEL
jgi:outer membrane murein-binding lipoprotein Lpp